MGFSWLGLILTLLLLLPNIFFFILPIKNAPKKIEDAGIFFSVCEKVGQVGCFTIPIVFASFNIQAVDGWITWLILAFVCIIIYYFLWGRYFVNGRNFKYLYASLGHIVGPMAIFPILAFVFIAIWGKSIYMGVAVVILAVGHITNTLYMIKNGAGK